MACLSESADINAMALIVFDAPAYRDLGTKRVNFVSGMAKQKPGGQSGRLGLLAAVGIVLSVWVGLGIYRRYTGPVTVRLETQVDPLLPFQIEMIPPTLDVQPGEVVNVIYRVRNTGVAPEQAVGRIEIAPGSAFEQIKVYLTECGGLNTYEPDVANDYYVTFKVDPAGLFGSETLTIRHVFEAEAAAP